MAARFPDRPSDEDRKTMELLIMALYGNEKRIGIYRARFYPCTECATHLQAHVKKNPVRTESKSELVNWLCALHNDVNRMLGKEIFDCGNVEKRWPSELCGCDDSVPSTNPVVALKGKN